MPDPTPAPPPGPTPHLFPMIAGIMQALVSAFATFKTASYFGLAGIGAIAAAGAVASAITSGFHRLAQKAHWQR